MTAAPVVYRIGSISLPAGGAAGRRDLNVALERALAAPPRSLPPDVAGRAAVSVAGGRVVVTVGASTDEVARAIAAYVHERLGCGGAT